MNLDSKYNNFYIYILIVNLIFQIVIPAKNAAQISKFEEPHPENAK